MKKTFAFFTAIFLAGCATTSSMSAQDAAEASTPLICTGKAQCELYWQKAQSWIAQNSSYHIQTATDTVISTYNSAPDSPLLSYQFIKEPKGNETYQILINANCDNMFGCVPHAEEARLSAKRYIKQQ